MDEIAKRIAQDKCAIADALGPHYWDEKRQVYLYTHPSKDGDGVDGYPNALEQEATAHAESFAVKYYRVPKDAARLLPKKGRTPEDLCVEWVSGEMFDSPHALGGRTVVHIVWDDGTFTEGVAICSAREVFKKFRGKQEATEQAIRQRMHIKRAQARAEAKASKSKVLEPLNLTV